MTERKKAKDKKKRRPSNFWYDFVKVTGILPALLWLRPRRLFPYGKNIPRGGMLIAANHNTFIDPIALLCAFPARRVFSLATKALYSNKIRTFLFTKMQCIPVDKDNFSLSSLHEVVDRLSAKQAIAIFPEGGISDGGQVNAFKSGLVLMAHKGNAPVYPIYIAPRRKWYSRQVVVMGRPIDVRGMIGALPTLDAMNACSEALREEEVLLRRYYEEWIAAKRKNKPKEQSDVR